MKGPLCEGCPCRGMGDDFTKVAVGNRYDKLRILIVGEASGEMEAREGLPFRPYGQAGSLLHDSLREAGLSKEEVAITNIIRCRPKNDWLDGAPYAAAAINHCVAAYLRDAIAELKPRVILAVGGTAMRALTQVPKGKPGQLEQIRGYVVPGAGVASGIPVISTFHSAFIRRGAAHLTPLFVRDIRRAYLAASGKLVEGVQYALDPSTLGLKYQTAPSLSKAWEWYQAMDYSLPLSFDIETPRTTREGEDERTSFSDRDIKLIQFTQRRGEGIAFPWRDEFVEVAKAILKTPTLKIGHNATTFDLPVLAANGVEVNLNGTGLADTLWLYHTYHPDLPANLQSAAQFCGFPFPWKSLADSDLAFYGICDVDAALCVYEVMTALLKREELYESYEGYVRDFYPILSDMAKRGVPIDDGKRLELKAHIDSERLRVKDSVQKIVPAELLSTKQAKGLKNPPLLKCPECEVKTRMGHACMTYVELAELNGLVQREFTLEKEEKCRCSKKLRSTCEECAGTGLLPAGLVEPRWAAPKEFNPNSKLQLIRYMKFRKHKIPKHAKRTDAITGEASDTTEDKQLDSLAKKTRDPLYPLVREYRQLSKVEGCYVEGWKPWPDGAIHPTFGYGPATWQLNAKAPNTQQGLVHGKTPFQKSLANSFKAMVRARAGHKIVAFDFKSFHAVTTGHEAGMADYVRLARIDLHSFLTCHYLKLPERLGLYERDDADMAALFKHLRKNEKFEFTRNYKCKRTALGIQFAMFWRKLFQLNPDDFENENEARKLWELIMVDLFPGLKNWQDRMRAEAAENKILISKFGAVRRFYDVQRFDRNRQRMVSGDQAEAAVAFLPANHAFGHVRWVMKNVEAKGWNEKYRLVNQIHDAFYFECPDELVEECQVNVANEMRRKNPILIYPKLAPDGMWVDADSANGQSLLDLH